jgi:hypothetical protein
MAQKYKLVMYENGGDLYIVKAEDAEIFIDWFNRRSGKGEACPVESRYVTDISAFTFESPNYGDNSLRMVSIDAPEMMREKEPVLVIV